MYRRRKLRKQVIGQVEIEVEAGQVAPSCFFTSSIGRIKIVLLLQDYPPPVRSETHSEAETKGKAERTIAWRNGVACDILKRRGVEPLFTEAE